MDERYLNEKAINVIADRVANRVAMMHKAILTFEETAEYMGVQRSYLYKLTMKRAIPFCKPTGKKCYFNKAELDEWLQMNRYASLDEIEQRAQSYCQRGGVL